MTFGGPRVAGTPRSSSFQQQAILLIDWPLLPSINWSKRNSPRRPTLFPAGLAGAHWSAVTSLMHSEHSLHKGFGFYDLTALMFVVCHFNPHRNRHLNLAICVFWGSYVMFKNFFYFWQTIAGCNTEYRDQNICYSIAGVQHRRSSILNHFEVTWKLVKFLFSCLFFQV